MRGLVLSLTVCAALIGCSVPTDEEDGGIGSSAQAGLMSLFEPVPVAAGGSAVVPFPNNGFYLGTTDASLNIPNATNAPFVTAANLTDGFSTTASFFTDFLGFVDFATASTPATAPGLVIINAFTGVPLTPGVDYTLQNSAATDASGRTIQEQRTRILIEPLKPLSPSTTYIVAVTTNLRDIYGNPAQASDEFKLARSGTAVSAQDPAVHPILNLLTSAQETGLESVRTGLVRPTVLGFLQAYNANPTFPVDLTENDIVVAWPFTTQSTTITLSRLSTSAGAQAFAIANTTISTGDLGLGLADTADVWAGTLQVPYYLLNNASAGAPLTSASFWANDGTLNSVVFPPLASTMTQCSALNNAPAGTFSTNICRPDPLVRSTETIPVLVAVPNGNSGQSKPANGWPVVIFQHGITRNRTDVLALAPTLAAAGFVTVAIDHPLHGVTNNSANLATNPFYRNQIFMNPAFGGVFNALITGERTFDMDFADNTPDATNPCLAANNQPDGVIDGSGNWFINLSSLVTSRDNLRQSVADLIHLTKSMGNLDLDQNAGATTANDIDETRIFFVGQSLGAIAGTTFLGVDTGASPTLDEADELITAASLNVPGGGVAKLLDASRTFGPRIAAGLSCSGVVEGTDTYETFLRFAQHLIDPADPINFAVRANNNHPIHMIEVIGDAVVPNAAPQLATASATQDRTTITGYLSGTEALYTIMGLAATDPFTPPTSPASGASEGADTVVRFAAGTAEHGTLLTPDSSAVAGPDQTFLPATCAMQKQTTTFFFTNGTTIPVGGTCP